MKLPYSNKSESINQAINQSINQSIYLSIYLSKGWSFISCKGTGWRGVAIFWKLKIFSNLPPPQKKKIHPSFLEMTPPHSLLPPINLTFCECDSHHPTSPAYFSYKSCWGSLHILHLKSCVWDRCLQFTAVTFNFNSRSLYCALIYFLEIY